MTDICTDCDDPACEVCYAAEAVEDRREHEKRDES